MNLAQIVARYAEAIEHVDGAVTAGVNARTGRPYLPGFKSLDEQPAVDAIDEAWEHLHPGERLHHATGVAYANLARAKVDHVLSTKPTSGTHEWGIEVKRLQHVGDNGKNNDFATGKVLSPYLKDRGLMHDALRLREHGFTERIAVLAYSFDYDLESLREAERRHTSDNSAQVLRELGKVVRRNGERLHTRPLIEFADAIMSLRGLIAGPRAEQRFEAWAHPAGGHGVVFAWEIRRPELEPDYDPRNPW